ncbi:hypothetical protein R1flu_013136 [Riccia fluitans]|uniref:Uncharacterized protein n=1 Tax=Riccia fluitans TaxID=41844 RepID=A0ABD1XEE9_9MARC
MFHAQTMCRANNDGSLTSLCRSNTTEWDWRISTVGNQSTNRKRDLMGCDATRTSGNRGSYVHSRAGAFAEFTIKAEPRPTISRRFATVWPTFTSRHKTHNRAMAFRCVAVTNEGDDVNRRRRCTKKSEEDVSMYVAAIVREVWTVLRHRWDESNLLPLLELAEGRGKDFESRLEESARSLDPRANLGLNAMRSMKMGVVYLLRQEQQDLMNSNFVER